MKKFSLQSAFEDVGDGKIICGGGDYKHFTLIFFELFFYS